MPLEIRELIIRTQIVTSEQTDNTSSSEKLKMVDTKVLVDQCVEKVLKALNKKKDR